MIYRFKIKKGEYPTSKLLFCSDWFDADDILDAIELKDQFVESHPEYRGFYINWENRRAKEGDNKPVLTDRQVVEIKQALADGVPGSDHWRIGGYLSQKYGVSRQTISHIKHGKTHQNV
jgi:hypothetical protein